MERHRPQTDSPRRTRQFSPIQYDPENPGTPGSNSNASDSISLMLEDPILPPYELKNKRVYNGLYEKLTKADETLRILKDLGLHKFNWISIARDSTNKREHLEQMSRFWEAERTLVELEALFSTLKKDRGVTTDLRNLYSGYKCLISYFIDLAETIPAQAGSTFERGTLPQIRMCFHRIIDEL